MAYSDAEKAEGLILLAVNFYDFEKTAADLGIADSTLRAWDKKSLEIAQKKDRFDTLDLLERAIQRLLMKIPEPKNLQEWGIAMGILLDKKALFSGMPTSRTENISTRIEEMNDSERDAVIAEAEAIFAEAASGSRDNGNGSKAK